MSSATSTEPKPAPDAGFHAGHFFVLVAMLAATALVIVSKHTHPAALLLLSAAALAAGFVAYSLHRAIFALVSNRGEVAPLDAKEREVFEHEKRLVLRAIKDLEFDYAMRKVSEADYQEMLARLRARALFLMQQLERSKPAAPPAASPASAATPAIGRRAEVCARCGSANDRDARFCSQCGDRIGTVNV